MCPVTCSQAGVPNGKQTASATPASQDGKQNAKPRQNGKAAAAPAANGLSKGGDGATAGKAERLKQEGNAAFKAGDFSEAVEAYGAAIELDPRNAVLYSNRAMASLKASRVIIDESRVHTAAQDAILAIYHD